MTWHTHGQGGFGRRGGGAPKAPKPPAPPRPGRPKVSKWSAGMVKVVGGHGARHGHGRKR